MAPMKIHSQYRFPLLAFDKRPLLAFACGTTHVKVACCGYSPNWHNFCIYKPIEMKPTQMLNGANRIQIG